MAKILDITLRQIIKLIKNEKKKPSPVKRVYGEALAATIPEKDRCIECKGTGIYIPYRLRDRLVIALDDKQICPYCCGNGKKY